MGGKVEDIKVVPFFLLQTIVMSSDPPSHHWGSENNDKVIIEKRSLTITFKTVTNTISNPV